MSIQDYDLDKYVNFLNNSVEYIKSQVDFVPDYAIVLGSGLSSLVDAVDVVAEVSFDAIKDFPQATNKMHKGSFIFGNLCGKKLVCINGRLHFYEGHSMWDVVAPIRICKLLGANSAIFTCASGAINSNYKIGDFMLHKDIVATFTPSPMAGPNIDQLGERFFDMTNIFDADYMAIAHKVADENNITLHEGIHVQSKGPQYETAAEIRLFKYAGSDTVSMSTASEEIAARHMGMRILGISFVSNMACGISDVALSDDDVVESSKKYSKDFETLIKGILENIN